MRQIEDRSSPSLSSTLTGIIGRLAGLVRELPGVVLTPEDRARLGGVCFPTCVAFVDNVAYALEKRPHLYPDLADRYDAAALREGMAQSSGWLTLHHVFLGLAEMCRDNHLQARGTTVRLAVEVADQVIAGVEHPHLNPSLPHRRRAIVMMPALMLLSEARQAGGRRKKPKAAPKPVTPRQAKARKQVKANRRSALFRLFGEVLAGWGHEVK